MSKHRQPQETTPAVLGEKPFSTPRSFLDQSSTDAEGVLQPELSTPKMPKV
jgi:hypothetical protein